MAVAEPVDYVISNIGTNSLTVSLGETSDGVEVTGLPLTVEPGGEAVVQVIMTSSTVGAYTGNVVFATNDDSMPTFSLSVTGEVTKARVSEGYHL